MEELESFMRTGAVQNLRSYIKRLPVVTLIGGRLTTLNSPSVDAEIEIAAMRVLLTMFATGYDHQAIVRILNDFPKLRVRNAVLYLPDTGIAVRPTAGSRPIYYPIHRMVEAYHLAEGETKKRIRDTFKAEFNNYNVFIADTDDLKKMKLDEYRGSIDPLNSGLIARAYAWLLLMEGYDIPVPTGSSPSRARVILAQKRLEDAMIARSVSVPAGLLLLFYLTRCHEQSELKLTSHAFRTILGALNHVCGSMKIDHLLYTMENMKQRVISPLDLPDVYKSFAA